MKKFAAILTLGLAMGLALGCTAMAEDVEPKVGGTYIIAQDAEPATLNPNAIADDNNYAIVQNLFPRLYKLNNAFQAIPDLATSYDVRKMP